MNLWPAFASVTAMLERKSSSQTLTPSTSFQLTDWLVLLLIIAALALFLMLWAKYLRKPKRRRKHSHGRKVFAQSRHHRHHRHQHHQPAQDEADLDDAPEDEPEDEPRDDESDGSDDQGHRLRYKYRYRRRAHRSRNPTLAETGGLPPIRTPEEQHRLNP